MFPCRRNGQFGYVGRDGQFIVEPVFKHCTPVVEGLGAAILPDGNVRIFNGSAEVVGHFKGAQEIGYHYSGGHLSFQKAEKWGVIDEHGNEIIPPTYKYAGPVYEGYLVVGTDDGYGLLRLDQTWSINPKQGLSLRPFLPGTRVTSACQGDKHFLVAKNGTPVSKRNHFLAFQCAEGVIPVSYGEGGNGSFGWVNEADEDVVGPKFDWLLQEFHGGLIGYQLDGNWGLCDKKGNVVVEPRYTYLNLPSEGLYGALLGGSYERLTPKGGKWGFVNTKGEIVIDPKYDGVRPFINGIATVYEGRPRRKYSLIDKEGNCIARYT